MVEIQDLVKKGQSLLEDGKFTEALSFFEQALLLNSSDPELWNHKGIALRSIGRYEEAMECFNNSLKLDPRDKNAS
jgi:Flp pilus assembly protein TadD